MNQLKVASSELVVQIVGQALAICGMAGYAAAGPHSVARHLRDAYSAGCMISNERLRLASATMLLAHKGVFGVPTTGRAGPGA
jgi:acyl-CoA dehydrogenase